MNRSTLIIKEYSRLEFKCIICGHEYYYNTNIEKCCEFDLPLTMRFIDYYTVYEGNLLDD